MAGKYFEIQRPGYSTLTTQDVSYTPNPSEPATINPFSPVDPLSLLEGEWLEYSASTDGWRATRGGSNAGTAVAGTPDSEGTVPAYPHWLEEGRFDMQTRRLVHLLKSPTGFTFRTRLCDTAFGALAVNDAVSVYDVNIGGGIIRRGLAKRTAGCGVGFVERIYGTNDIAVFFLPGAA